MKCRICNYEAREVFQTIILGKYSAKYWHCSNCGFLQTENPYWLKEAYKEPISIYDTGIISRNILFAKFASTIIYFLFNKNSKFVDFAGGY